MNKKQLFFCMLVLMSVFTLSNVSEGQQKGQQNQNTTAQVLDYIIGNKGHSEGKVNILLVPVNGTGEVKEWTISPQEKAEYEAKAKKQNAFTRAAADGDINAVEKLLSSGYEIDGKDEEDMTALMQAAKAGKRQMCEFLLSKKAGIYITKMRKKGEDTALTFAVISGNTDIVDMILAAVQEKIEKAAYGNVRAIDRALSDAVIYSKLEMMRYLADKGADVNTEFSDWSCILSRAVDSKNKEAVELLLSRNVNVNPPENIKNPLITAVESRQTEMAKLLILNGASVNTMTPKYRHTVLMEAAGNGSKEIVELLIEKGAEINARDYINSTALIRATYGNYAEISQLLLDAGADPNIRDDNGKTFLMIAVYNGFPLGTIESAILKGADLNVQDSEGMTPLMIAAVSLKKDIVELLLSKGADAGIKSNDGNTAAGLAEQYSFFVDKESESVRKDILKMLRSKENS